MAKSPDQVLAALREQMSIVERRKISLEAKDNLLTYTKFTMPDPAAPSDLSRSQYQAAKFHEIIARHLEEVIDGDPPQLIFCMPPRHGKTELATKRLTAWYSGKFPHHNIAVGSYSDTMAEDIGADVRAILASAQHKLVFPAYKLRRGGNAKANIQTDAGGRLIFVGRGGALTGRGAHLLLIDDLFKDHEEGRSEAIREQAWNWFTKVAMTRRMGKKLVIITMTRWHSDDVIGRLTDPDNPKYPGDVEAKKWKIIRLPALAEEDDPLGREVGEPLWADGPDTFNLDFLESQQRLDPLGFASLYQQSPTVADGTLFKRENIMRYEMGKQPEDLRYYCASDHAVGTKQRNDKSCFGKAGVDRQDNLWFTELFWERAPADKAVEAMLAMGAGAVNRPLLWWAERGHISKSIGPFLRKRMMETQRYMNVVEVTPANDKETRAQSFAARVSLGKVYFPRGAIWDKAIEEMLAFPNGTFDDFVDMCSMFGLGLRNQFGPRAAPPPPKRPEFGTLAWVKEADAWKRKMELEASHGGF